MSCTQSIQELLAVRLSALDLTPTEVHRRLEAEGVDVDATTVWRWFRTDGAGRRPKLEHYRALHKVLGIEGDARTVWMDHVHPEAG
jgi:hypothetical protein